MVVFVVHEVHRAAGDRAAAGEHRPMDVQAVKPLTAERRQERGMNVDHAAGERGRNAEQVQEPGQHHEIDGEWPADFEDRLAELLHRPAAGRDHAHRDARGLGDPHAPHVRAARHHHLDRRGERPGGDPVEQVVERPARTREQDGQAKRRCHAVAPAFVTDSASAWPSISCGAASAGGVPKWIDAARVSDSM